MRLLATVVLAGALALVLAGESRAAGYWVGLCDSAGGATNAASPFSWGNPAGAQVNANFGNCHESNGGVFFGHLGDLRPMQNGSGIGMAFDAPPGLTLTRARARWASPQGACGGGACGFTYEWVDWNGRWNLLDRCAVIFNNCSGWWTWWGGSDWGLPGGTTDFRFQLVCNNGGGWCNGQSTGAGIHVSWVSVQVQDAASHITLGGRSGLAAGGGTWVRGTQAAGFTGADPAGIRRARILVDGSPVADRSWSCDYTRMTPCPRSAGVDASVDTTRLADGEHTLAISARNAATDVEQWATSTRTFQVDNTPPTTDAQGQGSPTSWQPGPVALTLGARDELSGMGAADDDEPVEAGGHIAYTLDDGPLVKVRGDEAAVRVTGDGRHVVAFRAYDVAGNPSPARTLVVNVGTPESAPLHAHYGFSDLSLNPRTTFTAASTFADACPGTVTLTPTRDTWIEPAHPEKPHGGDMTLAVGGGARALLAFDLPPAAGCHVVEARLRLHATAAVGGRTLGVSRLASAWDDATTWSTRPGVAGAAATGEDVTAQVAAIYRRGDAGLLVRDLDESGPAQAFGSSEGPPELRPELALRFG